MVFFLSTDALLFKSAIASNRFIIQLLGHIPMIMTLCIWYFFARHEFRQYLSNKGTYFADFWNVLDCLSLSSILLSFALRLLEGSYTLGARFEGVGNGAPNFTLSTVAMSFALPITYLNTLYFMQGFKESGQLVRMIIGIIRGITTFLMIMTVCMLGFSFSFYMLFEQGTDHMNPVMAVFNSYTMMLGTFEVDDFSSSSSVSSTSVLFISFTVFINIIMLNLLIAIMGDIFDRIQENARGEFIFARANIVMEFEGVLSKSQRENPNLFPTWLQVLVPTLKDDDINNDDWVGRIKSLKRNIAHVKTELSTKLDDMEKYRERYEKVQVANSRNTEASLERLKGDNDRLGKLIEQLIATADKTKEVKQARHSFIQGQGKLEEQIEHIKVDDEVVEEVELEEVKVR
mmetsp:Transcript_24623/g.46250  ORF Transcript_24623/g.46250 Transcript_24623/m.46250 type:complete len:402 (+) Transcript_24623:2-1207(+)